MKLLLVSGPASGGIRTHLETLARWLPDHGVLPALAAPAALVLETGITRHSLEIGDRPRPDRDFLAVKALRAAIHATQPERVHAHGLKAALLAALAVPRGLPLVITFHNLLAGGPVVLAARWLLSGAHGLAVSDAVRESVAASGIRLRSLRVLPNGVDTERFTPAQAPPQSPTFAFAGRLTEEKGVPELLQAAAALRTLTELRIAIAGDGPLRPVVEQAADALPHLTYHGPLADVVPFYQEASALLVPSRSEGQGLSAVEAMACGLPVIASSVGGLPEVVLDRQTGLLVPPGDPEALVEAMTTLAKDPSRASALGVAGRARAVERFSQDAMLARLLAVYRQL